MVYSECFVIDSGCYIEDDVGATCVSKRLDVEYRSSTCLTPLAAGYITHTIMLHTASNGRSTHFTGYLFSCNVPAGRTCPPIELTAAE